MKHKSQGRKFGRIPKVRRAMLRNLLVSLFLYEKIKTTESKAKEIKGTVDKIINMAKKGGLSSTRNILKIIPQKNIVKKINTELVPKLKDRNSGYCKMYRVLNRPGDNAKTVILELAIPHRIEKSDIIKPKTTVKKKDSKQDEKKGWSIFKKDNQVKPEMQTKVTVAPRTTSK